MKCVIVLSAVLAVSLAASPFQYRKANAFASFQSAPRAYPAAPSARVSNADKDANIVRYENEINPDGSYSYAIETDNGIAAQEQGIPRNFGGNPPVAPIVAQGSYSYTSPEGVPVVITYTADENGYQPSGDVLPTPPPVPPQIARALEWIARNAPRQ